MQEKAKEPEIRFAGFTGAWEQRKFGEMANRRSEVSASGNLPRVEYEDIVSGTGTLNKDVFEKQSQKQGIVFHSGDVLYGKLRPYLQNWLLASFNGLAVGDFWVLEPQGLNSNYLYRIIQTKQFDEIANQSVGTKMPRADWKLVSKATFLNPASFNEQRLIGKFFKDIDSLLTLHQRKYEKLLNIKKSMLEKMFPKEGEVVPEIRFKGFTGAWEQRKLGELYEKAGSGGTPNASNASFYMGTIPFLGISDIKGRYITKTAKHISEKGLKSSAAWMVPSGAISLAMYASVGKVGITSVELATSQAFYNMVFASSSLRNFIFSRLEKASDNDEWLPLVSTGTQSNLNADKIKNWCISVPNSNEQKLVGEFFKKLDNLLTLHQRKLEMLKNVKQAFLEKMFV
jgi:type I restriction enzyme S subunit